jgi:hypothetical protein
VEPVDTTALDRSQEAIDEGRDAAKKALPDDDSSPDLDVPTLGDDDQAVTPRPS